MIGAGRTFSTEHLRFHWLLLAPTSGQPDCGPCLGGTLVLYPSEGGLSISWAMVAYIVFLHVLLPAVLAPF